MPAPFYSLLITAVGEYVKDYLREQKLILFSDSAPDDIAYYCALHQGGDLNTQLAPGQVMTINDVVYRITAVGNVATENLKQLGHITLSFDGASNAELPGTVHIEGAPPPEIHPGDRISFCHVLNENMY